MPRTLQKHMCPRQIRCSWLQCDCTKMLGKRQRPEGLYSSSAPSPIPFLQWQQGLCSDWFETDTRFIECVLKQPLIMPKHIPDTPTVRAIAVYLKFGVITSCPRCSRCSGSVKFESRSSRGWRTYGWTCASAGHKHMETQVNAYPSILRRIPVNSWMPFLHFTNLLRLGRKYADIATELSAAYGAQHPTKLRVWRRCYQAALGDSLGPLDELMVGGKNETVVIDETVVGVHPEDGWSFEGKGVSKKGAVQKRISPQPQTKKLVKKKVLKRLPARTVYKTQKIQRGSAMLLQKKPAGLAMKKPASSRPASPSSSAPVQKKPAAANLKNAGRWLWLAVRVGVGNEVCTHANKLKKVSYRLLPRKTLAKKSKPRGFEEISDTVQARVRKGTFLVHDGWTATKAAVTSLGLKSAPPVAHDGGLYRDQETGFHTNDAESENRRVKTWSRSRYGRLMLNADEMNEYVFYANVGDSMGDVLKGLAFASGGVAKNPYL